MRNHIVFKFLAIVLCAAALLSAVGGGVGIFVMTEAGLYEKNVDQLYQEYMGNLAHDYASNRWERYATQALGDGNEDLTDCFYGGHWTDYQFRSDRVGYTIWDGEGNIVQEVPLPEGLNTELTFAFPADGMFVKVLSEKPYVEEIPEVTMEATVPREEAYLYEAIPEGGVARAYFMEIGFADGSSVALENENSLGLLRKNPEGMVEMLATVDVGDIDLSAYPVEVIFYDENHICLYHAYNPDGVMESAEYKRGIGQSFLMRKSSEIALETIPSVTIPVETAPVYQEPVEEGQRVIYYNNTNQQAMEAVYEMVSAEGYTIHVLLAENPLRYEGDWLLVRTLYALRSFLPILLIGGMILFAITAVYLCCAAARKPKSDEVRPGGLNCIPLDLYAALVCGGIALLWVIAYEVLVELIQINPTITVLVGGLLAYAASLLIVGFCFACAAQFKTPGGYWWRHSVCGFCLKLAEIACRLTGKILGWMWKFWRETLWPGIRVMVKKIVAFFVLVLRKIGRWLKKTGKSLGKKLNRFFSLLPLTWQWLMTGFVLVFLLYVALRSYKVGWILLGFGLFFAVILYAASAFGILLENAKRMSKGDLDSKVEENMLVGGFKDFADELNGLADVAVVAAREQLKSERMKTELITNVSHDIKTPLTSIINYVDLLQKPHTPEDQEKYLEVLDRQSQRLKKLIDDLMEMSKASTGNLAVDITRVDAAEAVNQALGEFADKLDKAELYPVFRQPEGPILMMADGRLVWRVMSNLLSNAVKYALPGTRLYVDLQKLDSKVILSLKNISREELNVQADELLERFVRGDASRNTEGSGLGLNIAQSLMELQKGQLQILVDGDLFKVTLIFPAAE